MLTDQIVWKHEKNPTPLDAVVDVQSICTK